MFITEIPLEKLPIDDKWFEEVNDNKFSRLPISDIPKIICGVRFEQGFIHPVIKNHIGNDISDKLFIYNVIEKYAYNSVEKCWQSIFSHRDSSNPEFQVI